MRSSILLFQTCLFSSKMIMYQTEDGLTKISVTLEDDTVWLTQAQMAELFETTKQNVSLHINNIFNECELDGSQVVKEFLTTAKDGKSYHVNYYNLDVIISVGYRVKSLRGTQFRIWANRVLKEYLIKGFSLNDDLLKDGRSRYFRELLQRVRDIRSSERNLYQQVTDIYATAIDYNPTSPLTQTFFATVQNKLHYAAHQHTAAEIIYDRVDRNKPNVGMTSFKGEYATKEDVKIAKNYLDEKELQVLNLLVSQFLDFAELQALEQKPMTMQNWIDELDHQLSNNRRPLLTNKGTVSRKDALEKAEKEYEAYRQKEYAKLESDFDEFIKKLKKKND